MKTILPFTGSFYPLCSQIDLSAAIFAYLQLSAQCEIHEHHVEEVVYSEKVVRPSQDELLNLCHRLLYRVQTPSEAAGRTEPYPSFHGCP